MRKTCANLLLVGAATVAAGLGASSASADDNSVDPITVSTPMARPRDVLHLMKPSQQQRAFAGKADTNVIFLNNCLPNGCKVTVGDTDARVDTSDIASQTGVLTAFGDGPDKWNQVVSCVRGVFSRFNVVITDVDPGTAPHYEVMIAGSPEEIMGQNGFGIGGVADFPCQDVGNCQPYLPNALVFDFAAVFQGDVNELCAVAAQEIAHTWALDHVVDASDPLTYNNYSGVRQYHDAEKCGSDCQQGKSPFGLTCTGTGGKATHTCSGNGQATQDEVQTILDLFGPSGPPTPPTVKITAPADGSTVTPGFKVTATASDDVGVAKLELRIDGSLIGTDTSAPYSWDTAMSLPQGSHSIKVTAYDTSGTPADATVTVTEGPACKTAGDCSGTDTCVDGRCVPGGDVMGGLGTVCTKDGDCASGNCANDGTNHYCVESCDTTKNGCPGGFSCIVAGSGGVCWPTGNNGDSTGGCEAGGGGGSAWLLVGLGAGAMMLSRRRRKA